MTWIGKLAKEHPHTAQSLARWLVDRDGKQPFAVFLRGAFLDMPVEVQWGLVLSYFAERGYLMVASPPTLSGKCCVYVYRANHVGAHRRVYTGRTAYKAGAPWIKQAMATAFSLHETDFHKTRYVMGPDEPSLVAGMDYTSLIGHP